MPDEILTELWLYSFSDSEWKLHVQSAPKHFSLCEGNVTVLVTGRQRCLFKGRGASTLQEMARKLLLDEFCSLSVGREGFAHSRGQGEGRALALGFHKAKP